MSYKRQLLPRELKTGGELDSDLFAIGMNLAHQEKSIDPNIEDTLVAASIEAVNLRNGRVAGLLVDWISLHYKRINVDRLTQIVESLDKKEFEFVRAFWAANANRLKDRRFQKLAQLYSGKRVDYLDRFKKRGEYKETSFQIQRKGEDARFKGTCLRVPNKTFQERPHQIFPAETISKHHMAFRYRVMIGPTYRADMWAALRRDPKLSPTQIAKKTYGSYATAHEVKCDYLILKRDYSNRNKVA